MSLKTGRTAPLAPIEGEKPGNDEILDRFLDFVAAQKLELYPAQERAILEIFEDNNVILKTPTGSGKSLVAAAMHFRSLCMGQRSVYTCPIKALVNEKFMALCRDFGPENVGISTGDATVNQDAPILCCTAEVLANMALREGENLSVDEVIMDEFHYYSDRERGVSWQIPLLTLKHARFLLLSATIGETHFFEKDLTRLTGVPTVTVSGNERPVPLEFSYSEDGLDELLQGLHAQSRLPAYLVHFTQRKTAETAQALMSLDFCSKADKAQILEEIKEVPFNSPFGKDMRKYLRHGIGVHHAGMLPKYRILVEKLAQKNLLKLICGTDTLGVGVNVPIRSVVFTSLSKYDGDRVKTLPVRDFHQIAGRAGRRGFDDIGYVIAQAPEHVIENRKIDRKAKENPAKAKKLVKRKPPEKGFVSWDENTFQRLIASQPEPLTSSFKVSHGMLLNVLSRRGDGCRSMKHLVRDSHETPAAKRQHRKRAWQLFRALVEREIINILPQPDEYGRKVLVNVDLQEDFSLNQALSLYLIDTVAKLDVEDVEYPFLVLSLVESVLENPGSVLMKQVDKLKDVLMADMKAAGIPYEERIERLQNVEHPKPHREFIYNTFNEFAAKHPWVGQENIQPKSIAREMFGRYMSFPDYVREYSLQRSEGILLRHLSNVYKTLTQTVPEGFWDEGIEEIILYLEQLVRGTDASILDEWEMLRNPDYQRLEKAEMQGPSGRPFKELDPQRDRRAFVQMLRAGVFRLIQPLAGGRYADAAEVLAILAGRPEEDAAPPPVVRVEESEVNEGRGVFRWHWEALENAFEPYWETHTGLRLDPVARAMDKTRIWQDPLDGCWCLGQTLVDTDELNDWELIFRVDLEATQAAHEVRMVLESIERS